MARVKKEPQGPPPPAPWLNTFADLMNLLLCFFVLLFSMSVVSEEKVQEVAASMSAAFSIFSSGSTAVGDGMMLSNGVSQLNEIADYFSQVSTDSQTDQDSEQTSDSTIEEQYEQQGLEEMEQMSGEINDVLKQAGMKSNIEVDFTSQYVSLTMNGALLFASGSSEIEPEAIQYLDKIGEILQSYQGHLIEVIGHTDNVPISNSRYADNMELSCFRAMAVARYLQNNGGISPAHLQYSGRGEFDPIANNETAEGRALNRRVEIRIEREVVND